ncbi:alpha-L-arabinofuranosidase [Aureococcus anophagefferens]|uniref:Alpha-L-arabinofuranosidase n=1 Tax=Aureococcus anophagefferens TaxID=44056 RepID=A0ABR1FGP6_AURAN
MEAVYFGNANGGLNHGGAGDGRRPEFREISAGRAAERRFGDATLGDRTVGDGPWIMADMENALWGADRVKSNESTIDHDVVTAMGALLLGVGGDNSNRAVGTFYEGAVVSHYTTDATDAAVQANIVAAGYGK